MPYRPETWIPTSEPQTYPAPDPTKPGLLAAVGIVGESSVGYLILQGDALEWLTNVGPNLAWQFGVRIGVEEAIQRHLNDGKASTTAWDYILDNYPIVGTVELPLSTIYGALRSAWDVDGA